ncbi:MAG: inner membrane protein YphA [Planctomycetota bacterium]|jgi:putative oxidoreductase
MTIERLRHLIGTIRLRILGIAADAVPLIARLTLGQAFILAGSGKLRNIERTTAFFTDLGLPAPGVHAVGIGTIETLGGVLLVAGLWTRPAATVLAAVMLGALATAHRDEVLAALRFVPESGLGDLVPWTYALILALLAVLGPGRVAVDHLIGCGGGGCLWHRRPAAE